MVVMCFIDLLVCYVGVIVLLVFVVVDVFDVWLLVGWFDGLLLIGLCLNVVGGCYGGEDGVDDMFDCDCDVVVFDFVVWMIEGGCLVFGICCGL